MSAWPPLRRTLDFLALNRSMGGVLAAVVLVGFGERLADRFLPLYLVALGASTVVPGFVNGLHNVLSALYSYPGGWLTERLGYKRALALFNLVALLGFALVMAVPHWSAVVVGSFLFIAWSSLSLPATMSLVSAVLPPGKQVMGVSMHSLVRRIPMALGPVLGGVLVDAHGPVTGVRLAFGAAMILGIVALALQQFFIVEKPRTREESLGFRKIVAAMPRDLRVLLVADVFVRFGEQIPYAYLAIWVLQDGARLSATEFGVLTFVEMTTALLIYVPVAWLADRGRKKVFVAITFFNFAIFPLVLLVSHSFWPLFFAFVLRGLKEFGEPTRKAQILELSHPTMRAASFGAYYLLRDVVVSLAAFASGFLWKISPATNFLTAFALGMVGFFIYLIWGRDTREDAAPAR